MSAKGKARKIYKRGIYEFVTGKSGNITLLIDYKQKKHGYTNEQMADILGINPVVYRRKVLHPELFTYNELIVVFKVLEFTNDDIVECI